MPETFPNHPDPYLGEIRIFAPMSISIDAGWHLCDGSWLKISEYDALYTLLGTTFGGDGVTYFALPDLRGRVPVHQGGSLIIGIMEGTETVMLSQRELPAHTHTVNSSKSEPLASPAGNLWGIASSDPYTAPPGTVTLNPASIASYGFGYAHENRIPYMVVNFIIALKGIYPTSE